MFAHEMRFERVVGAMSSATCRTSYYLFAIMVGVCAGLLLLLFVAGMLVLQRGMYDLVGFATQTSTTRAAIELGIEQVEFFEQLALAACHFFLFLKI